MKSQMAACRLAARRMDELFDEYGRDTILQAIAQIFDETETKCRNVVSQLKDGVYEASAALDEDGVTRGEPVPIREPGGNSPRVRPSRATRASRGSSRRGTAAIVMPW